MAIGTAKQRAEFSRLRKIAQDRNRRLTAAGFAPIDVPPTLATVANTDQLRAETKRLRKSLSGRESTVTGARPAAAERQRIAQREAFLASKKDPRQVERGRQLAKWNKPKSRQFVEDIKKWLEDVAPKDIKGNQAALDNWLRKIINPSNLDQWLDYIHQLQSARNDRNAYTFDEDVRRLGKEIAEGATIDEVLSDMSEFTANQDEIIEEAKRRLENGETIPASAAYEMLAGVVKNRRKRK